MKMKNMVLLSILAGLLAFNAWWHEEPEKYEQPEEIPIEEDWECTELPEGKLECQSVLVWPDGSKYYLSEYKVIDNPNYKPGYRQGEKPNRFLPCEI